MRLGMNSVMNVVQMRVELHFCGWRATQSKIGPYCLPTSGVMCIACRTVGFCCAIKFGRRVRALTRRSFGLFRKDLKGQPDCDRKKYEYQSAGSHV